MYFPAWYFLSTCVKSLHKLDWIWLWASDVKNLVRKQPKLCRLKALYLFVCQCSVPWNKLTFSCKSVVFCSWREKSGSCTTGTRLLLWKAGSELFLVRISWAPAGFLLLLLPASCCPFRQNVLMLHKQCSDNRWFFFFFCSFFFFLNPLEIMFLEMVCLGLLSISTSTVILLFLSNVCCIPATDL